MFSLLFIFLSTGTWAMNACPEFSFSDLTCSEVREDLKGNVSTIEFQLHEISVTKVSNDQFKLVQKRSDQPDIEVLIPGQMNYKGYERIYSCPFGLINYGDNKSGAQTSRALQLFDDGAEGIKVFGYSFKDNTGHATSDVVKIERICQ